MRAVVMREFGDEDVLRLEDVPDPSPGPSQVLVRVVAVEVSRTRDIATRTGRHPFSAFVTLPRILGGDFGGVIEAVGAGVDPGLIGRRVAVSNTETCGECEECLAGHEERCLQLTLLGIHRDGSYAELATVAAGNAHRVPDDLPLSEAAALAADGSIAFTQLKVAGVGPGTKLLVTGVTGALGSTLAALGAHLGAEVIGLSRRPGEVSPGLPLSHNLDAADPELTDRLLAATDGEGIAAVADNVAAPDAFAKYFAALAVGACVVFSGAIGNPELPVLPVPAGPLYVKSISLLGVRTTTPADRRRLWELVDAGFRLPLGSIAEMPLEEAAAAHALIRRGGQHGHTILTVGS
ncbi:MAG TPA: alcohol dehydrogenase catalytic domain-containing protein [Solirubrobacterales bacterium]|nr:alcohol dehydrogenase catalytic domain-containing protein [Solirubrobacterales bacterium]